MQHTTTPDPADRPDSGDIVRTLLWTAVVAGALANVAASFGGADTWVHLVCGAITVLCAGTLAVRNLRGRR
ncbi:hypothetical protein [Streptomyces sp. NPDC002566]|uniref:hypothetical protein n=1 Tax=Streptomyces sp. NPDC002566 TaxID=3364650 RepID=UPI00367AA03F